MLKPGPLPPAATTPVAPTLSANLITAWPPRWAPSRGRGWSWWPAGTRTPTCPGTRRHHGSVEHALGIVIPPLQVAHVYPFDRRPWTGPSLRSSLARRLPSSRWTTPGQPPNDRRLRIPPVTLCRYPQTYSIPRGCRVVLVPPCLAANPRRTGRWLLCYSRRINPRSVLSPRRHRTGPGRCGFTAGQCPREPTRSGTLPSSRVAPRTPPRRRPPRPFRQAPCSPPAPLALHSSEKRLKTSRIATAYGPERVLKRVRSDERVVLHLGARRARRSLNEGLHLHSPFL